MIKYRPDGDDEAPGKNSKHSAECLCFPVNEPPFFAFEVELEMLTGVKCPLHGERFTPRFHIYVAKWLRAKQAQHLWTQYQAAIVRAITPRPEDALKELREAFQKGYPTELARRESDFGSLQHRPEFADLLAEFSATKK